MLHTVEFAARRTDPTNFQGFLALCLSWDTCVRTPAVEECPHDLHRRRDLRAREEAHVRARNQRRSSLTTVHAF